MPYYHIWFPTKHRRAIITEEIDKMVRAVFAEVAQNKGYNLLGIATGKDHAHILAEARDKKILSAMVRTLKAVSSKKILSSFPICDALERRVLWARRYGSRECDKANISTIIGYIRRHQNEANSGK